MKFCCALGGLAMALASDEGHDHDHQTCACAAKELGFQIKCENNTDVMLNALAILQDPENNCRTDCSSELCRKNYLIVQSHHDYCLHDDVPEPLEDGIHWFEAGCEDCEIVRKPDPNLRDCPTASCDNSGNAAYQTLLEGGCLDTCNSDQCANNYRILRVVHDTCPEDTLDQIAEAGIHDFEESCEAQNCNTQLDSEAAARQLICDNGSAAATVEDSAAATVADSTALWWLLFSVVAVAAMVAF